MIKQIDSNVSCVYKPARSVDVRKIILDNTRIMNVSPVKLKGIEDGIRSVYDYLKG